MDIDFARPYFGQEERDAVNRVMQGHWLANGENVRLFEEEFAAYIGVPFALSCNSGSSANLLALASLNLPKGSSVLTSGCGFPATLNPILHLGLNPVLVDYDEETCNVDIGQVLEALPNCKAAILAHTMGNPIDMIGISAAALDYGVPIIEDCCEAIGAKHRGDRVGWIGTMGTYSFYPSHHITALGTGGMVTFKTKAKYLRAKSMRDWGKRVPTNKTDTGRRNTTYSDKVDGMEYFPHYIYDTIGWNMQLAEANAAFGREQLKRMDWIVAERRRIHDVIVDSLPSGEFFTPDAVGEPSWFGVILIPRNVSRNKFGDSLERRGIRHRPFFAGNITRHSPYVAYTTPLPVADRLMEDALFIGCYAGMTDEEVAYVCKGIREAVEECSDKVEV